MCSSIRARACVSVTWALSVCVCVCVCVCLFVYVCVRVKWLDEDVLYAAVMMLLFGRWRLWCVKLSCVFTGMFLTCPQWHRGGEQNNGNTSVDHRVESAPRPNTSNRTLHPHMKGDLIQDPCIIQTQFILLFIPVCFVCLTFVLYLLVICPFLDL